MKIVVIGGSGLIGAKTVSKLLQRGHEVIAASPSKGVNSVTGEGLDAASVGADVVVDVSNSPSFEDKAVLEFFETSTRNILAAASKAGVKHILALSVVGTERLLHSGYFRAKIAQERMIEASGLPYSILRATQFFEFVGAIAAGATVGDAARVPPAPIQPIAAEDVADAVARAALAPALNGMRELAGPEAMSFERLLNLLFSADKDPRQIIVDPQAGYFGTPVDDRSLVADAGAWLAPTSFLTWLAQR
ncbi:SDR family oxidoreductase [Lacibacterium aquatile]|uniref:SDR family oxidoreductase n=1 Tax=Lacibacterium aquatile TaxID=1168082 RepID=A0ABW5DU22_9PROT